MKATPANGFNLHGVWIIYASLYILHPSGTYTSNQIHYAFKNDSVDNVIE